MIGNIGSLKAIPKPNSTVVQTALNLMAAYGGGDRGLRKDLEEMVKVQDANEKLFKEAGDLIKSANKAFSKAVTEQDKAVKAWADGSTDLGKRAEKLLRNENSLEAIKESFEEDVKLSQREGEEANEELKRRSAEVLKSEKAVVVSMADAKKMIADIVTREEDLSRGEADLADNLEGLRKFIR